MLELEDVDFGGFCKDIKYEHTEFNEDGNVVYNYSLRYQEFIFLTIHMLQKTIKRVDEVEERLAKLEEKLN